MCELEQELDRMELEKMVASTADPEGSAGGSRDNRGV
jgi:hypothetical protein